MSGLDDRQDIQTCREHHRHLEDMLTGFPQVEEGNAGVLQQRLSALKTLLLRHLRFEDDVLYPRLERSPDPDVVEAALRYKREMGGLAPQCIVFFDRWLAPEAISQRFQDFAQEWTAVRGALERRIAAEDNELYQLAERP